MSATPDSTLANPEQLIADLQRRLAEREAELAESKAERDEALQRETASTEVLQVINSSPGDLAPVFDAMLGRALQLCEAAFGLLNTWDGERWHHAAWKGLSAELLEAIRWGEPFVSSPGSVADRLVRGEDIISSADLVRDEAVRNVPYVQTMVRVGGFRSYIAIALRKDAKLLGAIAIYRQEVRPFTDKQIALLQNFAAQAVIAMENARLINETREALEQQIATAQVLQVINSSPGDLTPVFKAMLDKALALCGAAFGILHTFDGERVEVAAYRGVSPAFAEFLSSTTPNPTPAKGLFAELSRGESFIQIDAPAGEAYRAGVPIARALVEIEGGRTLLAVPLRKDGAVLGAFVIYRREVRPFTDKQISLLQNFAAQAVIAMQNARLLTETREALEQQTATAEVLQVINSSPGDLAPVFDAMLERATRLCEAPHGILRIWDGERFQFGAAHGEPGFSDWVRRRSPVGIDSDDSPLGRIVAGERVLHFADATDDSAYSTSPGFSAMVETSGMRSAVTVALHKDDALLGTITIYRLEVKPFTEKQIALLQNFAAQAVIAMENARLLTETREALEQQTATAEVLQVINASPGDLQPVFDAILEKATRVCEAGFGTLLTWDGERFHWVAFRGLPTELVEALQQVTLAVGEGRPVASRIVRGEMVISMPDLREEEHRDVPVAQAFLRHGARSCVTVALRKEERLLGLMTIYREEVRPFTEKQIALLQNFAAQAVIAMENARLLGELRERTADLEESLEYQTATSDVLQVISRSTFDLKPVLDTVIHTAARLCQAEVGHIATRDGDVYRPLATFAVSPAERDAVLRTRVFKADNTTVVGHAVSERRVIHVADVQSEPAYGSSPVVVRSTGVRTILAVPLFRLGEPIGVLSLGRWRVEPFNERQIELVRTFADQAVIAIENTRLLGELRQRTEEVAELNRGLEERVAEQVEELGRVGRLKRFLAPQLAELIVSQGDEKILESHRREIVVVFCDLRGYTAFTETAEPEEVLDFLREYHGALGPLVSQFEGTLDQFSGDGIMVFFNDPVPCPDPAERAVKMAAAMREAAGNLTAAWRRRGRVLGFGAGIAQGYATLGQIGFADRSGYTAIGTVCNLAARLCAEAKDGQILVAQRVAVAVEEMTQLEQVGELTLKGLTQPVIAYNVPLAASQPALRVIEGGPQSV